MMRSNRAPATAPAGASHAIALHASANSGARTRRASVRLASRCGNGRSTRPCRCASLQNASN
eukprot:8475996-Lingulodinium_polyedra.AAC.1